MDTRAGEGTTSVLRTSGHLDKVHASWAGALEVSRNHEGSSLLEAPIRCILRQIHPQSFLAASAARSLVDLNHVWISKIAAACVLMADTSPSHLASKIRVGPDSAVDVPPGVYNTVESCMVDRMDF